MWRPTFSIKRGYFERRKKARQRRRQISSSQRLIWKQVLIGVILFSLLGALGTGVWYGSRIQSLQIENVEIVGGKTIAADIVKVAVEETLVGSYFKIIPYRFILLYPKDRVLAAVSQIPRVKEVRVLSLSDQTLTVAFTEYDPSALWCNSLGEQCVFLDSDGYAFAAAPELLGNAFVRYQGEDEPTVGEIAFSESLITDTTLFTERLEAELQLFVQTVVIEDEIDISYRLAGGGEVKVTTRIPISESIANLKSILTSNEFIDLANGDFHYIDLRFGDKVFVSESEFVASSTASTSVPVMEVSEAE